MDRPQRILQTVIPVLGMLACAFGLVASPADVAQPTVDTTIYKHAAHIGWVVKDLDSVVNYWEKLGIKNIQRMPPREFPDITYRGKATPLTLKMAFADLGSTQIEWIQPVKGWSVYNDFLKQHGDGVHHVAFGMRSPEQLQEQVNYFKGKGVEVIQRGSWEGTKGKGQFIYLNTAPKGGGITFELMYDPDAPPYQPGHSAANDYPLERDTQYAPAVRDVRKVDEYYQHLGFGGMRVDHNISLNRIYRGEPGKFEMYLGWWRWPEVTFEWIQPLVGPSVYDEYLKAHGEGLHHIAFEVRDMDEAIALMKTRGAPASQTGGWNNPGGSGRFAYLDTEPHGGVTIELLWNAPKK